MNIFQESKLNKLLQEGKQLFRIHKPDSANRLQMEDKNIPLEDVMAQIAALYTQWNDEKILELINHDGQYYLRYLARRNIEVKDFLCRAADALKDAGQQAPQVHMIIIKHGSKSDGGGMH
jgi:hypothetical protein